MNRETIEDSAPQRREVVANSLVRDTAVELDKQLITGAGTGQNLTGPRNVSGVTTGASTGTNGASLTFAHLADTLAAAEAANVDPDPARPRRYLAPAQLYGVVDVELEPLHDQ